MNILITGAGGFIGSHLVERCRVLGHYVVGIDRREDWLRGDFICDEELWDDVRNLGDLEKQTILQVPFDLCFHLAADARIQPSFDDPVGYVANNVMSTVAVLAFCRKHDIRMIYAGSSTADDDVAKNVYATTKMQGEMLCSAWSRCFGLSTAIARFYNVYGVRQVEEGRDATVIGIWERQCREGKKLTVTGDGRQRRDFTAVEDIVEGLLAIAKRGGVRGQIYALGTGKNYGLLEAARMFVPNERIEFLPKRPGESAVTRADVEKTEKDIDWKARRSLADYVKAFLEKNDVSA
jgi:UDP-glucose 4-epimerase